MIYLHSKFCTFIPNISFVIAIKPKAEAISYSNVYQKSYMLCTFHKYLTIHNCGISIKLN
jgi:hypothetical protein